MRWSDPIGRPERRYIEARYQTLPFPLVELPAPAFEISVDWPLEDAVSVRTGYLVGRRPLSIPARRGPLAAHSRAARGPVAGGWHAAPACWPPLLADRPISPRRPGMPATGRSERASRANSPEATEREKIRTRRCRRYAAAASDSNRPPVSPIRSAGCQAKHRVGRACRGPDLAEVREGPAIDQGHRILCG